ncbi:MAG TPA: hypothetical protein PKE47_10010, partial [Verrucomicrobiota bacterium]|nr:hypothetical protein [Verrucomicrobiota bacterium]
MKAAMRFEVRLLDGIPEAEALLQETAEAMCRRFGTVLRTGPSVLVVDVDDRPENWEFMRDLKRTALE